MINVAQRSRLIAIGSAVTAVWLAWSLAQENYAVPFLICGLGLLAALAFVLRAPLGPIALSIALFGYIVGNRGFAQLMLFPGLPLLPAEIALLAVGSWVTVQCAFARTLPLRRDALNWAVL